MDTNKVSLKSSWNLVGKIILTPSALLLLIMMTALIAVIFFAGSGINPVLTIMLLIMNAMIAGLFGGVISNKWFELNKHQFIKERGYTTIRDINLLLSHIFSIKKRVNIYVKRLNREEFNYDLLKSHFEEVMEKCNNLFEDTVNAIENWQDIIPEANIKTQISKVYELKKELTTRLGDLNDLRKLGDKMDKEVSEAERGKLRITIERIEETLLKLETELKDEESKVLIDNQFYTFEEGKLRFADTYKSGTDDLILNGSPASNGLILKN
jgi:hypothetical protein